MSPEAALSRNEVCTRLNFTGRRWWLPASVGSAQRRLDSHICTMEMMFYTHSCEVNQKNDNQKLSVGVV